MKRLPNQTFTNLDGDEPLRVDKVIMTREQFDHVMKCVRKWVANGNAKDESKLVELLLEGDKKTATTASLVRIIILNGDMSKLNQEERYAIHSLYLRIAPDVDRTEGEMVINDDEHRSLLKVMGDSDMVKKSLVLVPFEKLVQNAENEVPEPAKKPGKKSE